MADKRAADLLGQHERLRNQRSGFEVTWQEIAERLLPRKALFNRRRTNRETKGEKRTQLIFDAVPALALDRFAAAVHSLVTPRNQVWQRLRASEEALNDSIAVKRYFDEVNRILFAARYSANFDNQVHESYYDLGAFATMCLYIGDTGSKIQYRSVPMWQMFMAENQFGVVDYISREYWLTARNAVKEFDPKRLPRSIVEAAERTPEMEFPFVCIVKPREDRDVTRADAQGMKYVQYEIACDAGEIVAETGYRTFPYPVSRYSVTPGDVYGRGPSEIILPDVKMLNDMNKTTMQAAQLRALPPILAHRDGILDAIKLTPAAINYGGVDSQGRQLIQALETKADVGLGLEMMDQKRKVIQDAFWNTLFQILVDTPNMTATEAMLRAQEKGALLAPTASRIESEFLAAIVERELDILAVNGALPDPPPELLEAGAGYEIDYESPMARARRAEEGVAILRTIEQLTPLATSLGEQGARVFRRFNMDETAKTIAEINGVPAKCLYTDDELAEMDEQESEQSEMADMLAAAPVAASAARDLAQAQAIGSSAPIVPQ